MAAGTRGSIEERLQAMQDEINKWNEGLEKKRDEGYKKLDAKIDANQQKIMDLLQALIAPKRKRVREEERGRPTAPPDEQGGPAPPAAAKQGDPAPPAATQGHCSPLQPLQGHCSPLQPLQGRCSPRRGPTEALQGSTGAPQPLQILAGVLQPLQAPTGALQPLQGSVGAPRASIGALQSVIFLFGAPHALAGVRLAYQVFYEYPIIRQRHTELRFTTEKRHHQFLPAYKEFLDDYDADPGFVEDVGDCRWPYDGGGGTRNVGGTGRNQSYPFDPGQPKWSTAP